MKYDALGAIVRFNEVAGNPVIERPLSDGLVKMYANLIEEELDETFDALFEDDRVEILDGAGDLIVVATGFIAACGVPPNMIMQKYLDRSLNVEEIETGGYDALSVITELLTSTGVTLEPRLTVANSLTEMAVARLSILTERFLSGFEDGTASQVELIEGALATIESAVFLIVSLGVHPNVVLKAVNDSNMSKFCTTMDQVQRSIDSYIDDDRYVDVNYKQEGDLYVILGRKAEMAEGSAPKILKNIDMHTPTEVLSGL